MRGELKQVEVPFGVVHLLTLFDDLNDKRDYHVISSMAGGTIVPRPISSIELEAFCRLRDIELTPWEAETIDLMDRAFREESMKLRGT